MSILEPLAATAIRRLDACYPCNGCDWDRFYQPRWERANFATRYHLVYPALAYFIMIKNRPELADTMRPRLDVIYRGLVNEKVWRYWHSELEETTWPLQERNLTYAGRLATFIGFYIDAFGTPPTDAIELGGRSTTYSDLSERLWRQMTESPSCGVSCYHHQSMVMCNAHMLINNILHDRLFETSFAATNDKWFETVNDHLLVHDTGGPLFYCGTESNSVEPDKSDKSLGADAWTLFLMSAVAPDRVREWFAEWQANITSEGDRAIVDIPDKERRTEQSSTPLASAWSFCLAKELNQTELANALRNSLAEQVEEGFELDPLLSGLYVLGEELTPGAFHRLVLGR